MSDQRPRPKSASPKKKSPIGKKKGAGGKKSRVGSAAPGARAAAEEAQKRLQLELEIATATCKTQASSAHKLEEELEALQQRYVQDAATAADVLQSQQHDKHQLKAAALELERRLEASQEQVRQLQESLQQALSTATTQGAQSPGEPATELERLTILCEQNQACMATQAKALESLQRRLRHTEEALTAERTKVETLQVRALSRTELRCVGGSPWLVNVARERLTGTLPNMEQDCMLGHAGGRLLLETPSQPATGAGDCEQPCLLHSLDIDKHIWSLASTQRQEQEQQQQCSQQQSIEGRAVCSVGSKLLGFGGCCKGKLLTASLQFLQPDLGHWLPAPLPAVPDAQEPQPRMGAALAHCPINHCAYLYGGLAEDGCCLADLWRLDLSSMAWSRLDRVVTSRLASERAARAVGHQEAPPPCSGTSLVVSSDGTRLWLMGGRLEGGRCSSLLYWYDVGGHYWARADGEHSGCVQPRTQHAMACIGHHVVIVGGVAYTASGHVLQRRDCLVFDTVNSSWDLLDSNSFEPERGSGEEAVVAVSVAKLPDPTARRNSNSCNSRAAWRQVECARAVLGAGSCVFAGDTLLLLKAGRLASSGSSSGLQPSELWTVKLTPPERLQQQRVVKQSAATVFKELSLKQDSVGATSVRLSWQAPALNQDKLLQFKLMLSNADGRTREAYEGPESGCEVQGLQPSSQYIFCVKALYDDTAFLWSQPLLVVTTKKAAAGGGTTRL